MGKHIKFIWNDSYNIGDEEVDEAHKNFFIVANDICDLSDKEAVSADELVFKINKLGNYVFYHFAREEEHIERLGFNDAKLHIKEHDVFRGKIADYMKKAGDSGTDIKKLIDEIADFVEEWILGHISQITREIKTNNDKK